MKPFSVQWLTLAIFSALLLGVVIAEDPPNDKTPAAPAPAAASATRRALPVRTGETRYSWKWLAARYDKDETGEVTKERFPDSAEVFARLDRNWDSKLTPLDFDWSESGVLGRQKETTFALFKSIDKNSDGRITAEEWEAVFAKSVKEKGFLNDQDLMQLIHLPGVLKAERQSRSKGLETFLENQSRLPKPPGLGEMAPDFSLASPDGMKSVKLSTFRGKKPVVLIFGNYSCGNYRTYTESLDELYQQRKGEVEFVTVYVREAHPIDDRPATPTNETAGILIKQPQTFEERCNVAKQCVATLRLQTPLVVDEIDNRVGHAYAAEPDRLYVIDDEGRIAYRGGPGPFGFNPNEMEQSLLLLLHEKKMAGR
jgi:hypothetical protein